MTKVKIVIPILFHDVSSPTLDKHTYQSPAVSRDVFCHFTRSKEKHLAAVGICQTWRHIAGIRGEKCLSGSCVVTVTARVIAPFVTDDI